MSDQSSHKPAAKREAIWHTKPHYIHGPDTQAGAGYLGGYQVLIIVWQDCYGTVIDAISVTNSLRHFGVSFKDSREAAAGKVIDHLQAHALYDSQFLYPDD